jgi:hypothetical protein
MGTRRLSALNQDQKTGEEITEGAGQKAST